ncbi:PstS family phosphate ABC transporter substrate-binding protein [Ferdinandcohnia quinoae]|uniref:PstS family phosphate ABC transporter substrate-binding protein n=1 Tax=Fredinandcohnia quinoae TaxID=2918902 RepID=A0AAW5E889_9BACI|nr:PstS family phosphate ABC transporter substrate-binding protein [Fredinandcohnia sp. SECRCQ15]MCH1627139.1 PstS family phosphate ABC transporter substrate-binding protein [Fredinandcohnia sp. SECRCQ15]
MDAILKVFGVIIVIVVFGFIGFFTMIVVALSGDPRFYVPFILVVTIGVIIFISLAIFGQFKKKIIRTFLLIFVSICVVSVIGYEGYQTYEKSLEVVSTQDVDLTEYEPFIPDTRAVKLDEQATLKINDDLPRLDGSTALYPVYAAFAQAVYPKKGYPLYGSEVASSQTDGAFHRLLNGEVDIIFMPKPSDSQMKLAEGKGIELTLTPIGREAFVFFVHKNNPVEELTIDQIQRIYTGEYTNWKEVGGKNKEIHAFQRPEGSGSQTALNRVMGAKHLMKPPTEDIVAGMGGIISETANYKNKTNAIGFSFRHFSQEMAQNGKIKHIAINGVSPTKENIQNETYPIISEFYAITADSVNPHIDAFIKWIQSDQGQKIIDMSGYVPM